MTVTPTLTVGGRAPTLPTQLDPPEDVPLPEIDLPTIVGLLVVLVVAYLLSRAVGYLLGRLSERVVTRRIGIRMAIPVFKFGIYLVAVFVILDALLELTTAQLLAFSGLLGAALGFGLKDLFAGVVGGVIILAERPYRVGDKVDILGHYGEVVDIGLRATEIETLDDDLVSVPNYTFFTEAVANANAGSPEMMVVTEFYVAPEADTRRAAEIVEDAAVTSRYIYVSEDCPLSVGVRDRPYFRLVRLRAYVNDHRHERAFVTDVTERVVERFEAESIEKPRGIDADKWDEAGRPTDERA